MPERHPFAGRRAKVEVLSKPAAWTTRTRVARNGSINIQIPGGKTIYGVMVSVWSWRKLRWEEFLIHTCEAPESYAVSGNFTLTPWPEGKPKPGTDTYTLPTDLTDRLDDEDDIDTYTLRADTGGQTVVVISVEEYERLTHIARLADITAAEYDEWREGRDA